MLRSPTHSPTIPLTQVHLQFNGDRSTGAQIHRKLYHDHFHQTQHYKQQRKKEQQQRQQQQQKQYLISKTAEKKFLPPVRVAATEIKPSDDSNSSSCGDSMREVAAVATTLATNFNLNKNKNKTTTALRSSLTNNNDTNSCCSGTSQLGETATSSSSLILSPLLTTTASTTAITLHSMSPTSQTPSRTSLFDSCHRKIRLIGGGPVAFLGGLVAKARRKERDGDQNSTDTKLYLEESVLERKLPEADLKALVDLPAGLDYNEWLASHTLALFEHVNLVYGTVSEFCTPSGCPDMTGPGNRTYLWFDEKGKKTRVAAPQYIDYVMTFTQKTVSDESIFPTKYANEFPSSFESIARKILRLQFHVIAHLYAAHFREIALLGLHTHLNLTFAHLTALHRRFNLIDEKETDVLRDLEVALQLTDVSNQSSNSSSNNQQQQQHGSNSDSGTYETGTNYQPAYTTGHGGNSHHYYPGSTGGNTNSSSNATAAVDDSNVSHATAIDGDASSQPICTQPEAKAGGGGTHNVFGGGGGLMGGILGDFTGSEFSDTSRYCTSAVPSSSSSANNTNGAGALQLNFNNNYNAHAHQHHLQHHHHQQHQHQPPSPHNTTTA